MRYKNVTSHRLQFLKLSIACEGIIARNECGTRAVRVLFEGGRSTPATELMREQFEGGKIYRALCALCTLCIILWGATNVPHIYTFNSSMTMQGMVWGLYRCMTLIHTSHEYADPLLCRKYY